MKPNKLELNSVDGTQLNLEALYQIAPSCFTEVKDDKTGELRRVEANCAVVVARFVASPAFCIPTSIAIVLFLDVFIPTSFPAPSPNRYPSPL